MSDNYAIQMVKKELEYLEERLRWHKGNITSAQQQIIKCEVSIQGNQGAINILNAKIADLQKAIHAVNTSL